MRIKNLRAAFTRRIYADHNDSFQIRSALERCVSALGGRPGLNIGNRSSRLHPSILNFDIEPGELVDCVGDACALPFAQESFSLVITQETLEHVRNPQQAMHEIFRILKPGGVLYCQLPFVIGYHPGPYDFWRFTREGIVELIASVGLRCSEVCPSVGPAFGFYRIATEFIAVAAARFSERLYRPTKGAAALLLYPIKWFDPVLLKSPEVDRIPGGYFVIAIK